jgi:hypothetical protein
MHKEVSLVERSSHDSGLEWTFTQFLSKAGGCENDFW